MADRDHDEHRRDARFERDWQGGRDWRSGGERDLGDTRSRFGPTRAEPRAFGPARAGDGREGVRGGRDERPASYEQQAGPFEPGGGAARGYGEGGDTSYGQMASGSSDSAMGGYGGANVGGFGQSGLNSQWGAPGYGPLNQGLDYGQGGGHFGPAGYDTGDFGRHARREPAAPHHDEHHASYRTWRDAQLAAHDHDYGHWRNEQARRYDEEYGSWRNERHSVFNKEFEGWRAGRGGQATDAGPAVAPAASSVEAGFAHGANPTLAKIADGHEGHQRHEHDKTEAQLETDKDTSRH